VASPRIEWAERMIEIWNSGDVDQYLDEVGPDFVFTPDPIFPDFGVYSGQEFRDWMHQWAKTWKDNSFEMLGWEEIGDAGLIRSRWHLEAPGTGDQVPVQDFTIVVFWDGPEAVKPHRMAAFFDHEQAVEVAKRGTG
jgi:hypothetical protein